MDKEIYISESMGESRIAIIEDGTLVEVYVEKQDQQRMVGNIYKGKVENVLPGMQAAFVDIGYDINAFLPFSEIENVHFRYFWRIFQKCPKMTGNASKRCPQCVSCISCGAGRSNYRPNWWSGG